MCFKQPSQTSQCISEDVLRRDRPYFEPLLVILGTRITLFPIILDLLLCLKSSSCREMTHIFRFVCVLFNLLKFQRSLSKSQGIRTGKSVEFHAHVLLVCVLLSSCWSTVSLDLGLDVRIFEMFVMGSERT